MMLRALKEVAEGGGVSKRPLITWRNMPARTPWQG